MSNTTAASANVVTKFHNEVNREYVRGTRFGPYIAKGPNAIIQIREGLKKASIPLIGKLSGGGVEGSGALGGNEEALSNFAYELTPTYYRNGVLVDNEENEKTEFDLFREARPALQNWAMELKRDQIIQALGGIEAGDTYYNYGGTKGAKGATAASAANMDTWNTNNQDRVLYGAAKSNNTSGDHTASLSAIDTTNDKLDAGMISLAKRMAKAANPIIRPYMLKGVTEEWYVFFVGTYGMRDLKADTTIAQANREARPRNVMNNPIFTDGDLVYDGVIIREIPEIDDFIDGTTGTFGGVWGANATGDSLATGGDSSSRVGVGFLCGAQAIGFGLGRMPQFKRRKEDDYEHLNGVGLACKHDLKKTFYNNKQHGMVTVFHSAAVDS